MTILDNLHEEQQEQGGNNYSTTNRVMSGSATSKVAFFGELCEHGHEKPNLGMECIIACNWSKATARGTQNTPPNSMKRYHLVDVIFQEAYDGYCFFE